MPRIPFLCVTFVLLLAFLAGSVSPVEARRKNPVVVEPSSTASDTASTAHTGSETSQAAVDTVPVIATEPPPLLVTDSTGKSDQITIEQAEQLTGLASDDLSQDYSPDTIQSTRRMDSGSKRIATFFLMYTRADDVQKTIADVFSSDVSAGDLTITPNTLTNAIVARVKEGKGDLLKEVSDLINSLDFRNGQVVIDVLVVDVTISDDEFFNLEVKGLIKNPLGTKDTLMNTAVDQGSIDKNDPTAAADGFKTFITSQDKLKIFLNAAKRKGNVKVVSSPHIVSANHRKAIFKIGEKLSLISSVRPSDSGPIKSYSEKEVGLSLEVTPHINRGGQIDVEIDQTIDAVDNYDQKEGTVRMTNRRATTNLTVSDGETIVLGGFIEDRRDEIEKRTPLLSNIPVLGKAFTYKTKTRKKTELMVFLTPRVLDTKEDVRQEVIADRDQLSTREKVAELLKKRGLRDDAATRTILIPQRSREWEYDFGTPETDVLVWQIPEKIDPNVLKLPLRGSCPFGFGSSKRLSPAAIQTYLKPSDGVVFRREFSIEDPSLFKTLSLHVASNNAAAIYINGKLVDEDPEMKLKDGHDFEYWNRVRDDIPGSILTKGRNTIVALLANDKTTTDAYFDMLLVGNR